MKMEGESNSVENRKKNEKINYNIEFGKILGKVPPGEEVAITGMSGVFPSSKNVHEFRDNLYNKIDMVTPITRWKFKHSEIPDRAGNIPEVNKFDAGFFELTDNPERKVGLVAEMQEHFELEISGTPQQKISNCLNVLDGFMRQKDSAIVSSMVVAEKRGGANASGNIVDAVVNILGLTDTKTVSLHSPLAELGMDSMTGVEIKQTLEREFDVFLTPKDIRSITLARLKEVEDKKNAPTDQKVVGQNFRLDMIFWSPIDESESRIPIVRLKSLVEENETAPKVILFPGIDGVANTFDQLASRMKANVFSLQYGFNPDEKTIGDLVQSILPTLEQNVSKSEPFKILSYSFGSIVALEVLSILESKGYTGSIVIIDGSSERLKQILTVLKPESEAIFQTSIICQLLSLHYSSDIIAKHEESIFKCSSWDDRLDVCRSITKDRTNKEEQYQRAVANTIYNRLKAIPSYTPLYSKLSTKAKLYKPNDTFMDIPEDYGLSKQFKEHVDIQIYEGNHVTILENELMAKSLNVWISDGL